MTLPTHTSTGKPYCSGLATDPDGDGFGYENGATCIVRNGRNDPDKVATTEPQRQVGAVVFPQSVAGGKGWSVRATGWEAVAPLGGGDGGLRPTPLSLNRTAAAVYDWMVSLYGDFMISGQQMAAEKDSIDMLARVENDVGLLPAIAGFDFINYTNGTFKSGLTQTEKAIDYWKRGGLVHFCWHWRDPSKTVQNYQDFKSVGCQFEIPMEGMLLVPTQGMQDDLAVIKAELQKMRDAGVVVLWRPLHEAANGHFWWGRKSADGLAAYRYQELWRWMYRELEDLDNLIWVWNAEDPAWYPGDRYVHLASYDSYPNYFHPPHKPTIDHAKHHALGTAGYHKLMVAVSENDRIPDPDEAVALPLFFNTWHDWDNFQDDKRGSFYSGERYSPPDYRLYVYHHPRVITLKDVPLRF